MLHQNPAIQSRVEVHLVEEAKGGPSKLLLSFLLKVCFTKQLTPCQCIIHSRVYRCEICHLNSVSRCTLVRVRHLSIMHTKANYVLQKQATLMIDFTG
jgi:hypothetical protein